MMMSVALTSARAISLTLTKGGFVRSTPTVGQKLQYDYEGFKVLDKIDGFEVTWVGAKYTQQVSGAEMVSRMLAYLETRGFVVESVAFDNSRAIALGFVTEPRSWVAPRVIGKLAK